MQVKNDRSSQSESLRGGPVYPLAILVAVMALEIAIGLVILANFNNIPQWYPTPLETGDSAGFLDAARRIMGEDVRHDAVEWMRFRLFSPLLPALASVLGRFMELKLAFFTINVLLWIAALAFLLKLGMHLTGDRGLAFATALLFTTSMVPMIWGVVVGVDMGSFAFAALLALLVVRKDEKGPADWLLIGIIGLLGSLAKISVTPLAAFVLLGAACDNDRRGIAATVVIWLGGLALVYALMGLGIDDFFPIGAPRHRGLVNVLNALVCNYHLGLLFALLGFLGIKGRRRYYLQYLFPVFGAYCLFVHNPRLLFITFPAILPLVVLGMNRGAGFLESRLGWDRRSWFVALTALQIVISNLLAAFYVYFTRTLAIRSPMEFLDRIP